jgi:hypothetical protein
LDKAISLLDIKTKKDLRIMSSMFPNSDSNEALRHTYKANVYKSMDTFMSAGFNKIVIVESDNIPDLMNPSNYNVFYYKFTNKK